MYKFAAEHKEASKKLIRDLYEKYYLNSAQPQNEPQENLTPIHNPNPTNHRKDLVMAKKGAYTVVRETIASKIEQPNSELVQICKKKLPRVSLAAIKGYVARAAWELRKEKKDGKRGKGRK